MELCGGTACVNVAHLLSPAGTQNWPPLEEFWLQSKHNKWFKFCFSHDDSSYSVKDDALPVKGKDFAYNLPSPSGEIHQKLHSFPHCLFADDVKIRDSCRFCFFLGISFQCTEAFRYGVGVIHLAFLRFFRRFFTPDMHDDSFRPLLKLKTLALKFQYLGLQVPTISSHPQLLLLRAKLARVSCILTDQPTNKKTFNDYSSLPTPGPKCIIVCFFFPIPNDETRFLRCGRSVGCALLPLLKSETRSIHRLAYSCACAIP